MRKLVESKVIGILNEMADDGMDGVEFVMDMDMGFWNADDGPKMTKEVYEKIVADLDDEELLVLHEYLVGFNG